MSGPAAALVPGRGVLSTSWPIGAQSATQAGLADAVAPGAAGALWLTSYPPDADTEHCLRHGAGGQHRRSTARAAELRLPAGYLIEQATDRGLLLAPVAPQPGAMAYQLWESSHSAGQPHL